MVSVNPEGVEASAATGISIVPLSGFFSDLQVNFNRPFLYFIVEKSTKMILFSGVLDDPTKE